jgi:Sulfotransferase family
MSIEDTAPIFVVGAMRSGTTMLRLILNAHPNIGIPGETDAFWERGTYRHYLAGGGEAWQSTVTELIATCRRALDPPLANLDEIEHELRTGPADFGRLLPATIGAWAVAQGKPRWGEKTPLHMFAVPAIMSYYPTAKVIAVLRDPRATVASTNRHPNLGDDAILNARLWRETWTVGWRMLESSVPASQRMIVRYEQLTRAPEATLREVCVFLGEPFDERMLRFGETAPDSEKANSPLLGKPIQAPDESWRSALGERGVRVVEHVCRRAMRELGYKTVAGPPRANERFAIAWRLVYARAKQWQHRDQAYHVVSYSPFGSRRLAFDAGAPPGRRAGDA